MNWLLKKNHREAVEFPSLEVLNPQTNSGPINLTRGWSWLCCESRAGWQGCLRSLCCELAAQNCSTLLWKWGATICTEENSLFPLRVQSFKIHLGKVIFISEHYFRSGLNCACCFKWHTKEEHQLWDGFWQRNICPFPEKSIVPLLPCHWPSPSLANNFLLNTEGKTAEK